MPGSFFTKDNCGMDAEACVPQPGDEDVDHFRGPIWHDAAFSTDAFAFSTTQRDDDVDDSAGIGFGKRTDDGSASVHNVEICCVRCSDVVGGDALLVALDLSGVVSFWRILEMQVGQTTQIKLALQGVMSLASGPQDARSLCGSFLDATYLCIHPQQQAEFVVMSTAGIRQANRQRSSTIADGPASLALVGLGASDSLEEAELAPPSGIVSQPCCGSFNPFLPGLLLAAYADGDLALFDSVLCVPVAHWAGACSISVGRPTSVAWSPLRPCVFFVKAGASLDVWDLAANSHSAVLQIDVSSQVRPAPPDPDAPGVCCELYVGPRGHPVVGQGGAAVVLQMPANLTTPLEAMPPQHATAGIATIDSLLRSGCERASKFPTLERNRRPVEVSPHAALECEVLHRVLAGKA
jgi:hypothetical protein